MNVCVGVGMFVRIHDIVCLHMFVHTVGVKGYGTIVGFKKIVCMYVSTAIVCIYVCMHVHIIQNIMYNMHAHVYDFYTRVCVCRNAYMCTCVCAYGQWELL